MNNSNVVTIAVGVDPEGKPVGSILEAAKLGGFKTGLVVTSTINHATPACTLYNTYFRLRGGGRQTRPER